MKEGALVEMYCDVWFSASTVVTLAVVLLVSLLLLLKKKNKTGTIAAVKTQNNTQPSSSTTPPGWEYEVFLSFRGEDIRTSFTDFLYTDLSGAGIRTFRDNDELRFGEKIGPELLKAIRQSKISIPIFSANYASSKWCLMELRQMVECMRSTALKQTIFPIFYDVEPSDVRNQTGASYGAAFRNHQKRFDGEMVNEWKEALREVAELKGWEVKKYADGHQGKLIKDVVSKVLKELKKRYLVLTDSLVGIDYHVEEMMRLLSVGSNNVTIVGIHGMGGIGKTTISKAVYNNLVEHFECCSFLADVRETALQPKGLVNLQNKLLSDILKGKDFNVTNIDEGINTIKDRFCNKKVLIVLDDVDQRFHLDSLAGKSYWFGPGSRIIVTTRNKDVLNVPEVDWTYEPKEMDFNQSLQLFSKHAFRMDHPHEEYDDLSRDVVSTASGLPLALEIMGSFLSGKKKDVWRDTVKKLKRIPNDQVQKKLRISYEALDYEQKEIFLDIACLVIGMDKRIAVHMWDDCEFYPENGIEVLLLMSLVKIGDNYELRMHDQLRGLGREIVREENFREHGKRSRLWHHQDALDVLESQTGTGRVEALCLNFEFESRESCFTNEEFAGLSNLRFLQIDYANLAGDFQKLFLKLRWLRWNGCPQNFEQTNFHLKNLVILDLSWSKVTECWEGWSLIKTAKKLKVLNLTACSYLIRTPDFSSYPTLERLILEDCERLVQIDPTIGHLQRLVLLNLKNCAKLNELPLELGSLESLVELLIDGTSVREVPFSGVLMKKIETISATCSGSLTRVSSSIGHLVSLSYLAFDFTRITELPDSIGSLVKLRQLSLRYCLSLAKLPDSIGKLESLTELHLFAAIMTELPDSIGNLKNLRVLDIDYSCITKLPNAVGMLEKLEEIHASHCYHMEGEIFGTLSSLRILTLETTKVFGLPSNISGFSRLQTLNVIGCRELRLLPELPSSLINLHVTCVVMETFPNLSNLINLKELVFSCCLKLVEIPRDIGKLSKLETLTFYKSMICTLPSEIGALHRLKELVIDFCDQLQCLPALPSGLFKLCLQVCESLERLPDLSNLKNLMELNLGRCLKLTKIQGLEKLELLTSLDVSECKKLASLDGLQELVFVRYLNTSRCKSLQALPDLSKLKKLQKLVTLNCKNLTEIPGVDRLESLQHLNMSRCISMEELPNLSSLGMLRELVIVQCEKLREIQGIEVLKSIKRIDLSLCTSLERLPNLSNLKDLKELLLQNCEKLTCIRGLEQLKSLAFLDISGCKLLEGLPDLSSIKKVKR